MPDHRVDKEFPFRNIANGSPGGQSHDGNILPKLVFWDQDARPFRRDVFLTLNADPVNRMKTEKPNRSNEFIEEIAPADAHSFNTRRRWPFNAMVP